MLEENCRKRKQQQLSRALEMSYKLIGYKETDEPSTLTILRQCVETMLDEKNRMFWNQNIFHSYKSIKLPRKLFLFWLG